MCNDGEFQLRPAMSVVIPRFVGMFGTERGTIALVISAARPCIFADAIGYSEPLLYHRCSLGWLVRNTFATGIPTEQAATCLGANVYNQTAQQMPCN